MTGLGRRLIHDLQAVMQNPQADPRRTVVFLGGGVLLFLILIVLLLLLVAGGPKRPKRPRRRFRERMRPGYLALGLIALVLGVLLAADEVATAPSTCARCHEISPSVASHKLSTHTSTDCMGCHGGRGITGFVTVRVGAAGNLLAHVLKVQPNLSTSVPNGQCLGCHDDVLRGTKEVLSIRVRHSDFVSAGEPCLDCHGNVGHGAKAGFVRGPTMDKCISCHDGTTARSGCAVCHRTDIAVAREIPESYPKAHLAEKRTCEGCHSLAPCKECHGLDMPHPADFATPEKHASLAAFEKKETLCYRCHKEDFCMKCHESFGSHGPDWKTRHALGGRSPLQRCKDCHDQVKTESMCDLCHKP